MMLMHYTDIDDLIAMILMLYDVHATSQYLVLLGRPEQAPQQPEAIGVFGMDRLKISNFVPSMAENLYPGYLLLKLQFFEERSVKVQRTAIVNVSIY